MALSNARPDATEHVLARVLLPDVPDEHHIHMVLPRPGPAEDRGLAAFEEGADEVDDLDARLEDLRRCRLVHERRRLPVDRIAPDALHGTFSVDRLADDVEEPTEGLRPHRDGDRTAGVEDLHATTESIR